MAEKRTVQEVLDDLERLVRKRGYFYSLGFLICSDLFVDPRKSHEIDWHSKISFQEFSLLFGLLVRRELCLNQLPDEIEFESHCADTYGLLRELHDAYNISYSNALAQELRKPESQVDSEREPFSSLQSSLFAKGEMLVEPIFYGGSGAYDFQYLEFAVKKYRADDGWLLREKGISIEEIAAIASRLKTLSEEKYRKTQKPGSFAEACAKCVEIHTFSIADLPEFAEDHVRAFLRLFSCRPGAQVPNFSGVGSYNVIDSHPIIEIDHETYYLPIAFSLAQSVYESPFYWMHRDGADSQITQKNRGEYAESLTFELCQKVFGSNSVHRNVDLYRKKGERIGEVDVLVLHSECALLFQVKSKRLTESARMGKDDQVRRDFQGAVQESFEQGVLCKKALLDRNCRAVSSYTQLDLAIPDIRHAWIICVTSDHYPALLSQVRMFLKRGKGEHPPLTISLFDLDLLVHYLSQPTHFLYYVRQRVSLHEYFLASSEVALLAMHLNKKLFKQDGFNLEAIDESFAQLIDANFPVERGMIPDNEATKALRSEWDNPDFREILNAVERSGARGRSDILFFLMDVSGESADELVKQMKSAKLRSQSDGGVHDFAAVFDGPSAGLSYLVAERNSGSLASAVMAHAQARKYRSKASLWLGLGAYSDSQGVLDGLCISATAWKFDPNLERLASNVLRAGNLRATGGGKVGANQPCPCGSGKKFKRCCGAN